MEYKLIKYLFIACLAGASARQISYGREVIVEDNKLLVAFDSDTAALTRMEDKSTHWVIERRPELGVSFRLFAPLPERRYNPVFGQRQHVSAVNKISNDEVQFQWTNMVSENGGTLPIALTADVRLTNGVVVFGATLENDSPLTIETIDYPYFGDFNPPTRDSSLEARTLRDNKIGDLQSDEVYPHFRNEKGYWGVSYPTKTLEAQQSRFCLLQAPEQGLYVEMDNSDTAYRLQYTFEQHPGVVTASSNLVPKTDFISGFSVNLEFRLCHFIFQKPHSTTKLAPISLRCYQGDWHKGIELYKENRSTRLR